MGKPWTDSEIAVLVRQHQTSTAEQIGALIERSPASVRTKAQALGINTRLNPNHPHYAKLSAMRVGVVQRYLESETARLELKAWEAATDSRAVHYPCTAQSMGEG